MGIGKRFWTWLWLYETRRDDDGRAIGLQFGPLGWTRNQVYWPIKRHWSLHWKWWIGIAINVGALVLAWAEYVRCEP